MIRSPISIDSPPSPQNATTCRFRSSALAPSACGIALAIEPRLNEPIRRRWPVIRTNRDSQTVAIPVSVVKIASCAAWRSSAAASSSGRISESGLSTLRRSRPFGFASYAGSVNAACRSCHFA